MATSNTRVDGGPFDFDLGLRGRWLLSAITVCCASGFLLVGYDNGVMGGLVETPAFRETFDEPTASTIGNIVSLYEIGCFFGAISTFITGERFGRRKTILIGSALMLFGAIVQAASHTVGVMILGRLISGLGMGAINATVPVLQAEMSPAWNRGAFVALDLTVLNIGIVLSYWVDYGFNFGTSQANQDKMGTAVWRVPIALQCVFIVVVAVTAFIIPETPRWLAAKGRKHDAISVLVRLRARTANGDFIGVQDDFNAIEEAVAQERATANRGWLSLLKPYGDSWRDDSMQTRKRLLLACFIQAAQQLGGINALIYYSSTLFTRSIGMAKKEAALMSGGLNMCLILGSTLSIFAIDRIGRRRLLLPCITGMSLVMIIQSIVIKKIEDDASAPKVYGRVASSMLFLFELFFSLGFQATVWLIPSEILPLTIRTKGSALSTASNWICNFAIVKLTPSAIENIGWRTYVIFAILNAAWLPVIYFFLPETMGKTLEEVDLLFLRRAWETQTIRWNAHDGEAYAGNSTSKVVEDIKREDQDGGYKGVGASPILLKTLSA